ncbi:MAG: CotH kinase family protein [Oscillospiraceae bacterium]|nr:CotH kinase family protein [Oscillospiraceae bacterium]
MSKNKYTTAVCLAIVLAMIVITCLFYAGESLGVSIARADAPYAASLFSGDRVHTIDIVADEGGWADMLANARNEEYIQASVVIDGRKVSDVGIRPKGNSSLSTIASSDSDRYSFKVEFDHYVSGRTYLGLDKLALNNIAQDNTYMKDFVSYKMMAAAGADAPLCSFIYLTVNGEDWGLYLAVEGIEDAFAKRVYGADHGQIYKPDSMNINQGGERGGMGNMPEGLPQAMPEGFQGTMPEGLPEGMPEGFQGNTPEGLPEGFQRNTSESLPQTMSEGFQGNMPEGLPQTMPEGFQGNMPEGFPGNIEELFPDGMPEGFADRWQNRAQSSLWAGGMGGFGRSGGAATLVYTDDDPASYSVIFDNAAFTAKSGDDTRLIDSLKKLNEQTDLEATLDISEVLSYFAAHNFTVNQDSYTGTLVHNYYIYEKDGKLSMIPWDYNLAFGGMGGMGGMGGGFNMNTIGAGTADTATSSVNTPIDSLLNGSSDSRPMWDWIASSAEYTAMYHETYMGLIESFFDSGEFAAMYDQTIAMISPFVEKDPTAFCTYDEFIAGQAALREYCLLRAQSVKAQLAGEIASTSEAQTASGGAGFVDASTVNMEAMGSNTRGFGNARGGFRMPTRGGEGNATPDNGIPGGNAPGNTTLNDNTPDNAIPNSNTPDNAIPDSNASGNAIPDSNASGNAILDGNTPDNAIPDSNASGNTMPNGNAPGNAILNSNTPDNAIPDSNASGNTMPNGSAPGNAILNNAAPDTNAN